MLDKETLDKVQSAVDLLTETSAALTDKEVDFLESIESKLVDYGEDAVLTPKQLEWIDAIIAKNC